MTFERNSVSGKSAASAQKSEANDLLAQIELDAERERKQVLDQAAQKLKQIELGKRDSILKNRGFSLKLNIGQSNQIGKKVPGQNPEELLLDGGDLDENLLDFASDLIDKNE